MKTPETDAGPAGVASLLLGVEVGGRRVEVTQERGVTRTFVFTETFVVPA